MSKCCRHCKAEIEFRSFAWSDRETTTGLWFPGCSLSPTFYHAPGTTTETEQG